jgi:DNA-binding CsgD family transcriptional regulator
MDVLARLAIADGHYVHARSATRESLLIRQDLGSRSVLTYSLESIAALAAAEGEPQCALQLAGAAASIRDAIGERQTPMGQAVVDQWLVPLQHARGQDAIRSAWETGRAMPIEQALELGLVATQTLATQSDRPPGESRQGATQLSPREQQVAALLANGLTNRQIAEQLVVSQRTVASHIEHILEKLGFASRHQVGVWAAAHGLHAEHRD